MNEPGTSAQRVNFERRGMSAPQFFVDENILAVARALAAVRRDVVYPGHRRLPEVTRGAKDDDWLPVIGYLKRAVITRDKHLRTKPAQLRLLREHGVRVFCLTGKKDASSWDKLGLIIRQWHRFEHELATPGPWFMSVTHAGVRRLSI